MKKTYIDINCDVGEGMDNEQQLLPLISSCNIACGGHAGNKNLMREVVALSKQFNVKVGAHPSYPDRKNFGRVSMEMPSEQLKESIISQIEVLRAIASEKDITLHHIKPHGALYNDLAGDVGLAKDFLSALEAYKSFAYLYVPYHSIIEKEALKHGFKIKREAFVDRNYNSDLTLVSRSLKNALIEDPRMALERLLLLVKKNSVKSVEGNQLEFKADTYCIHGDQRSAYGLLKYLYMELPKHAIYIEK